MSGRSAVLLVLVAAGWSCRGAGGMLSKVWEMDLRHVVGVAKGVPEFPIYAMRFSPDGRRLAVIADVYGDGQKRKSRLVIIDTEHPQKAPREFEVDFGIRDGQLPLNFGWSPSGEVVYAVGTAIHLDTDRVCRLPNQTVFVSDNVAISTAPASSERSTSMVFYDGDCKEKSRWRVAESWLIEDVSQDRGVLSVMGQVSPGEWENLIVDPITRKVLRRWPGLGGGQWRFADSGKTVCQGGQSLANDFSPAVCKDVDTGQEVARSTRNGDEPLSAAARSTRVALSDVGRRRIPFLSEYETVFHGRYVWDFGTGKELVSWNPSVQTYPNMFKPKEKVTEPFRFAISPDGLYIAEGGNGIVRFSRIEP